MSKVRTLFEKIYHDDSDLSKSSDGKYLDHNMETKWRLFLDGWNAAIQDVKTKSNPQYSNGPISDGGLDPRN